MSEQQLKFSICISEAGMMISYTLNMSSHFPFIPYRRNEMSKLQIILFFVAYFICTAPFVRLMLKWDSYNADRKNDTKCHLLMNFLYLYFLSLLMFRFITGARNKGQSLFKSRDLIALNFMEKSI